MDSRLERKQDSNLRETRSVIIIESMKFMRAKKGVTLYLLDTPYYARNLYRAIAGGIPGVRKSWSGPLQWRDWPETRELIAKVEHRFNLNKLGKHGYPGAQMAERIQLLRYQNSINCRWRRLRWRLHYNGWRTMFEKAFEGGGYRLLERGTG